jgi:HlyD family secretion protein
MTRGRRRLLLGLAIAGVLVAVGVPLARRLRRAPDPTANIPTLLLEKREFLRRVTAEGGLKPANATPLLVPSTDFGPLKIGWLAQDGSAVKKGDVVVRFDPTDLERQLKDGRADLATADAKLKRERIQSDGNERQRETSAELARRERDATKAYGSKDEKIFSRNQIIESEIDDKLSEARVDHANGTREVEKRLSRSKVELIEVDRKKAQLVVKQATEGLQSLEVTAPHDGILVLDRDWRGEPPKVGEQAWPGDDIAEIPILAEMEAEVFVLEADGGGLAEGQKATVVIESQPIVEYAATVKTVDKLAKPRQRGVPVQYFAVTLKLERTDPAVMKPGQRVRGTLILDRNEAVVVPRQAVFEKEGKTVVYRLGATGFEPVAVELGSSSAGRVVVDKGLAAGDRIALRDPTRPAPKTPGEAVEKDEGGKGTTVAP